MTTHDDREGAAKPTVSGPQAEAAVAPAPGEGAPATPVYAGPPPAILSDEQRALLVAVLDTIVPPNAGLSGAGSLGVDAAIERTLAQTPRLRRIILDGLAEIAVSSAQGAGQPFTDLDAAAREAALRTVEEGQPAFFAALVEHAYRGYYTHPEVHAAIGYPDRAPQPQGHTLAPFREELLQIQRQRQPFWRPDGS
ncbi:MAG: gluconate 2-dehydrogenase subunit 3 family protein [Chloroflexota bacterium]